MNKIKLGMLSVVLLCSTIMKAQSIEDGKKFMYYERYKSAKAVFDKLIAANANNVDAIYWLGQTMISQEERTAADIAAAKTLYQNALMANSNSGLLLAGIGHVELLENKPQDARNRFETAISLTQSKSIPVLNAVGFANVNAKAGDAAYAIDKLNQAVALKGMKDPDVYINLGDAYKKAGDGGKAILAYESALGLNANYARASYRIGKVYQTQGPNQKDIYERYFNDAIAKDPTYGPVYENLYNLYYLTDVTRSAQNLEKFLANKDDDPKNCYYLASMKYAQGLFSEAVTKADECITAGGSSPYAKLYGIKGYAYSRSGDSVNAKAAFEKYFAVADSALIGMGDYSTYAGILLKFPGNDSLAGLYVDKAVALDTIDANKTTYLKSMAASYEAQKNYSKAADWYNKILYVKPSPSKTEMYYAGYNYFRSGVYDSAISVFTKYGDKFTDDPFGYYMVGKSYWAVDSNLTAATANPFFEKAITSAQAGLAADSVKYKSYKSQLIGSYKYFLVYYATSPKKDKDLAIQYADKILAIDPNDAETIGNKEALTAAPAAKKPAAPAPPAKPAAPKTPAKQKP